MSTRTTTMREFSLAVPSDFIELPIGDLSAEGVDRVHRSLTTSFGGKAPDESLHQLAFTLCIGAAELSDQELTNTFVGLYRSPDPSSRPIMMTLSLAQIPSDHTQVDVAIQGIKQTFAEDAATQYYELTLNKSAAIATVRENQRELTVENYPPIAIRERNVTAWVPVPSGSAIATMSITSNNWQDWDHICDLALGIFDSFTWSARETTDQEAH